ncbi:MAG TPA: cytochrome c [Novosphingobium sp.]|nr:cytochrome c [Novosphingobium sp.]
MIAKSFAFALLVAAPAALMAKGTSDRASDDRGAALFAYHCAACHGEGPGHPGTQALDYRDKGAAPALLTRRGDIPEELVAYAIRNGVNAMPYFRKTEISDADIRAIAAFLRHPSVARPSDRNGQGAR